MWAGERVPENIDGERPAATTNFTDPSQHPVSRVLFAGPQVLIPTTHARSHQNALAALALVTAFAATPGAPSARTGAELYSATCAACHGADGKGAPKAAVG